MLDRILIGSSAEPTDTNFKNVTLLLHGDGSNGAQNNTFIDSSTNNFTITRNGNTTQGSFSPYGSNWSNYFDGTDDHLTVASNAAFAFGTGDFTIECWVYVANTSSQMIFVDLRGASSTTTAPLIYMTSSGVVNYYTNGSVQITGTGISANSWNHLAVSRSGTSTKLFINGTQAGSTYSDSNNYVQSSVYIGRASDTAGSFVTGYMSNVRILKGTALYTSNFTPSTTPLTAITNTSLLTCAYNRFRDGSTNNFTITRNGDVKVTNFAPFAPSSAYSTTTNGGSAVFDGTSDYCRIASSQTALQFGTGDFTIDGWVFSTNGTGTYQQMLTGGTSWTSGSGGVYWYYNSGSPYIGAAWNQVATNPAVNSGTLDPYAWHHFAFVRSGNTLTLYVNGTSVDTLDVTGTSLAVNNQSQTNIGGGGWDNDFAGYMSNVRVVKGTAVYTANFTPPTSPTTAVTNTQLLLNATNAAIFDNSMKNDLETVGNAQISTSVKKFGTGSMAFDGSGDYLDTLSTYGVSGSEAYTIEGWIYPTSVSGRDFCIYETRGGPGFVLFIDGASGGYLRVFDSSAGLQTASTTAISANTWTHFALVRQAGSSTNTFYVNGTSAGTFTLSSFAGPTRVRIGARNDAAEAFVGYIDDFRISKGIARYTSNFTAPTAPFPNK